MAILNNTPRSEQIASGTQTIFPTGFEILDESDLEVYLNGVLKTLNVHYTVTGVGVDSGGNVVFNVAPSNGTSVVIVRATNPARTVDYQQAGSFRAAVVNADIDRIWAYAQEQSVKSQRSLTLANSATGTFNLEFTPQPNRVLAFDATGQNIVLYDVTNAGAITLPLAVSQGGTAGSTPAEARLNLGLVKGVAPGNVPEVQPNGKLSPQLVPPMNNSGSLLYLSRVIA